jgi:ribosome assembly protein YihI (activator of Der GTPase)
MLSNKDRQKINNILDRIEANESVSLNEMIFVEKYAKANRHVYEMLKVARRRSIGGVPPQESLDGLLDRMNLGDPDPSNHKTGTMGIDELTDFFHNDTDHMGRD